MARCNDTERTSYHMLYEAEIAPKLREIDIFIKSCAGITAGEASRLLMISEDETRRLMTAHRIRSLDRRSFFTIMADGSSWLCKLFRRECELGSPFVYSADEIAYIYALDAEEVRRAFDETGVIEATAYTLPLVFSRITV